MEKIVKKKKKQSNNNQPRLPINTEEPRKFSLVDMIKGHQDKNQNFDPKEAFKQYLINKNKSLLDISGLKYRLMSKYHPLSTIKVNMELSNGEVMPFVVRIVNGGFIFDGGFYIIDEQYKYFDNNAKLWCFDYHEELCFPINKRINLCELKKEIYEDEDVELETAINPKSLQKFMESTVIQKLLAGAEMEDSMQKMKMYMIITIVITAVTLLLMINASGLIW